LGQYAQRVSKSEICDLIHPQGYVVLLTSIVDSGSGTVGFETARLIAKASRALVKFALLAADFRALVFPFAALPTSWAQEWENSLLQCGQNMLSTSSYFKI
jgi:hypothetical protein